MIIKKWGCRFKDRNANDVDDIINHFAFSESSSGSISRHKLGSI